MSAEVRSIVDFDPDVRSQVRLGRNRALRAIGVGLFGAAVTIFAPERALAYHGCEDFLCESCACPCGCCGSSPCCSCDTWDAGCGAIGHCWFECSGGRLYRVCEWTCSSGHCCCSTIASSQC